MTLFASQKWMSNYFDLSIAYNPNVWRLIPQVSDGEEGVLFGVIDPNDGASFGFDLTVPSSDEYFEYEFGEAEYFSRIFNVDNDVKETGRFPIRVSGILFECVAYAFNNPRYGRQKLVRGMYVGPSEVMSISIAWPFDPSLHVEDLIPPKFQFFLDNLVIGDVENA